MGQKASLQAEGAPLVRANAATGFSPQPPDRRLLIPGTSRKNQKNSSKLIISNATPSASTHVPAKSLHTAHQTPSKHPQSPHILPQPPHSTHPGGSNPSLFSPLVPRLREKLNKKPAVASDQRENGGEGGILLFPL